MANTIREALQAVNPAPDRLEIEITQSAFLDDRRQLQDLGVWISLDDFGTGHSSLSYLHSFPLNKVKIDGSFLQGLQTTHERRGAPLPVEQATLGPSTRLKETN